MDLGLYEENCIVTMERMPSNFIALTVTSPPYDRLRKYKGAVGAFRFEEIARHLFRVTKEGGVVVWVIGDQTSSGSETGSAFRQALYFMVLGFNLHDTMIFRKKNTFVTNHKRYEQEFEYMFVFVKGKLKTFNPIMIRTKEFGRIKRLSGGTNHRKDEFSKITKDRIGRINKTSLFKIKGNVWEYAVGANQSTKDTVAFQHPAIFPEALARDHIISWSNPGDIVYDPLAGSGTVPKMAKLHNRKWIASEVVPEYCQIIKKRLAGLLPFPVTGGGDER